MSVDRLRKMQFRMLRRVLSRAYDENSFYRKRFKLAGITPLDVRNFEDFRRIPIFGKEELREEIRRSGDALGGIIVPEDAAISNITLTSGSTGPNTFIGFSARSLDDFVSQHFVREFWMQKLRPGMKVLLSLGSWHFYGQAMNLMLASFGALPICPYGTQFPMFAPNFVQALQRFRPDYMITVTRMLYSILSECERVGLEPRNVFKSVKYVVLGADPISPATRRKLVDELGVADVFEAGGSSDGLWGGGECYAHKGHHVWMDTNYIEVLDRASGEPVEEGRGVLLSTNLLLGRTVYIRYDSGDVVEVYKDTCDCGRTHLRLEILDRVSNVVKIKGVDISVREVTDCLEELKETMDGNFCIVRESPNMPVLRLLASHNGGPKRDRVVRQRLRSVIRRGLGVETDIWWVSLDRLPSAGGKLRRVVDGKELGALGPGGV